MSVTEVSISVGVEVDTMFPLASSLILISVNLRLYEYANLIIIKSKVESSYGILWESTI